MKGRRDGQERREEREGRRGDMGEGKKEKGVG